jgi:glycosyltransferase involved in cell wall biosynthesis
MGLVHEDHAMSSSALFITYDGLLDPLGGSQILPYLYSIARHPRPLHILSFEKPDRYAKGAAQMRAELTEAGIGWTPLSFTAGWGKLGKVWDMARMYFWSVLAAKRNNVNAVHARGHPPAQTALFIKRLTGAKLIFDFRGLWVDERVDKGGWNLARRSHRWQYWHFKRTERKLLANADQIVVLTHAVVPEVCRLGGTSASKITVIPCCADFDYFSLATAQSRAQALKSLSIPEDARVLGYLGSVGRMYMLDRFFRLFELAVAQRGDIHALVVTQDVDALNKVMGDSLPAALHARVHIRHATRNEIPSVIPAIDVLVSFIQPSYARMAASPTKLAECFSAGIPSICNSGVGDVAEQIQALGAGVLVDPCSDAELSAAATRLDEICAMGGRRLREVAREVFGLEVAAARYQSVYSKLN